MDEEINIDGDYETNNNQKESNSVTPKRKRSVDPTSPGANSNQDEYEEEEEIELEEEDEEEEQSDEDYVDAEEEKLKRKKARHSGEEEEEGDEQEEEEEEGEEGEEGDEREEEQEGGEEQEESEEEQEEEEEEEESEEEAEDDSDIDSIDLELNDESDPNYKKKEQQISTSSSITTAPISTAPTSNTDSILTTDTDKEKQQQQQKQEEEYDYFNTGKPGDDYLIPVKLEITQGFYKLSDSLLWNLNEKNLTPQQYVHRLCVELDYPDWFEQGVIDAMTDQIQKHRYVMKEFCKLLPLFDQTREFIINIQLDLNVNALYLRDRFQWDLFGNNSPEIFARSLCQDLGLSREFEGTIAFSIRDQIQYHLNLIVSHPQPFKLIQRVPLKPEQAFRTDFELPYFSPSISHHKQQPILQQQQFR